MDDITVFGMLIGKLTMSDRTFIYEERGRTMVIPFDKVVSLSVKLPKGALRTGLITINLGGGAKDFINIGPVMAGNTNDIVIAPTVKYQAECAAMQKRFADYQRGELGTAAPSSAQVAQKPVEETSPTNLLVCPECGNPISKYAAMCVHCGCPMEVIHKIIREKQKSEDLEHTEQESISKASMVGPKMTDDGRWICRACGAQQKAGRRFCIKCGKPFTDASEL